MKKVRAMKDIIEIIKSIDTTHKNLNPTVIYNEGWMTRLLVRQSTIESLKLGIINFSNETKWTSEALISSPFIKVKKYPEGHTHADIAVGDFEINFSKRGEVEVDDNASIFGIIEAKMGSNLTPGTSHVKEYNQATRNLVCIAHNCLTKPDCKTFFYVVAPDKKIKDHDINSQIALDFIKKQIENRFNLYPLEDIEKLNKVPIIKGVENCTITAISYEKWISMITDATAKKTLENFYAKAKIWNRI